MMAILPSGWDLVKIGDHLKVIGGYAFKSSDFEENGHPVVRISNLRHNSVELSKCARIPDHKLNKGKRFRIEPGDTLIAMSGATTGKLGYVPDDLIEDWYLNQRVGIFRIEEGSAIDKIYLRFLLSSDAYQTHIWDLASGVAQPNISGKQLESANIPLPPLAEQKRIAKILDVVDNLRAKRRTALAQLDTLLQSTFLDLFGDPVSNPKGWARHQLVDIAVKITDGEHLNPEFSEMGMPIVMAKNVLEVGVDLESAKWVESVLGERFRRKCGPEKGDILLVSRGATIGRMCVVDTDQSFCLMGSVILIKLREDLTNPSFLSGFLKHPATRRTLYRTSGSSAQQAVYLKDVKRLTCMLPPLDLQCRFATIAEPIEQQKARHREHLAQLDILFASLQQRAFKGEL